MRLWMIASMFTAQAACLHSLGHWSWELVRNLAKLRLVGAWLDDTMMCQTTR